MVNDSGEPEPATAIQRDPETPREVMGAGAACPRLLVSRRVQRVPSGEAHTAGTRPPEAPVAP